MTKTDEDTRPENTEADDVQPDDARAEEAAASRSFIVTTVVTIFGGAVVRIMSQLDSLADTPLRHWYVQLGLMILVLVLADQADRLLARTGLFTRKR